MKIYEIQEDLKKGDLVYINSSGVICKTDKMQQPTQHFTSFFEEMKFGKYSHYGMTLLEAIDSDKTYIKWCFEHSIITVGKKIEDRFNRKLGYE